MNSLTLKEAVETAEKLDCSLNGKGNGMIKLHSDQEIDVSNNSTGFVTTSCLNPDHNFTWNDLGIEEARNDST